MNLSPKKRFQSNKDLAKQHADWCAHSNTHAILESALAEFAARTPVAPTQVLAVDYYQRLQGAKDFIALLLHLSEPQAEQRTTRGDNLAIPTPKSRE